MLRCVHQSRGTDVKKSFASHLYDSLKKHGLRVFLDMEEMQKGVPFSCQIEGAIRTAIFSTNYAESNWCLNELLLMLEMQKNGSTIIPVFFGVKPSELRWTEGENGVYAKALCSLRDKRTYGSHKPRYDSETIGKWKKGLRDVAEISGFEMEAYNGNERRLLDDIVYRVQKIVPKPPLYVSQYPTGLDDKLEDFEATVSLQRQQESGEAKVVGIVGLGGVGKTTLAKEFYNRARKNYGSSCFLFDVRDTVSKLSFSILQRRLIEDLTGESVQINSKDEGIKEIKRRLSFSCALIILDDVDHDEQLEALLSPAKDVLSSSSLILVTSRNWDVLKWGIDDLFIYKLEGLNQEHSKILFCSYAFRQPHPVAGFEEMVNEFLDACNGLPLSLKVIGALLYRKNNEYWKAQLRKISKVPVDDIQKRLKISFDSLDEEEKQIFLDIACCFIGEYKGIAIRIWDGSGWEGSLGLQNLQNKCLVEMDVAKISWANREKDWLGRVPIRMHDQLRDMGIYLATKEYLQNRICLVNDESSCDREIKSLAKCSRPVNERRMQWFRDGFQYACVFSVGQQLICFRWLSYPYSNLPDWIPMENLRVLEIGGTELEILWRKGPLQLRELRIDCPSLTKIPKSIRQLKHLEQIVLHNYHQKTLPDEFCQLQSLKKLDLSSCSYLQSLPDSFGNLIHLKYLCLHMCEQLTVPSETLGKITTLEFLRIFNVMNSCVPSLGYLKSMEYLVLGGIDSFRGVFVGMWTRLKELILFEIKNLERLVIDECPSRELAFGNIGGEIETSTDSRRQRVLGKLEAVCPNLQRLEINTCPDLEEVGALPTTLTELTLLGCPRLRKIGGLCTLAELQRLKIVECGELELQSIETLVSLETLLVLGCVKLKRIEGLGQLTKLQELDVSVCDELEELAGIEDLRSLNTVNAFACPKLQLSEEVVERLGQRLQQDF